MMDDLSELYQKAQQLRVSWRKAHNYWSSFATIFYQVKSEFDANKYPDITFANWITKAGLLEDQVIKMLHVFERAVASEERDKITAAHLEMENARLVIKTARMASRNIELERQRKLQAELRSSKDAERALRDQQRAERDRIASKELAKKRRLARKAEAIHPQTIQPQEVQPPVKPASGELDVVADQIRSWKEKAEQTRIDWIDATMHIAELMVKAREHFPSDTLFGKWLVEQNINYNTHDRTALIHFGYEPEIARKVLEETDRRSYKWIWEVEVKPKSKVATIG